MLFAIVRTSNINMAILLTKLKKGLSDVRALNLVISRRCKTLVNETNHTKTQNKIVFDSGVHPGDSGFQVMGLGFQSPGCPVSKEKVSWIQDSTSKSFADSGIRITLQCVISSSL